MTPPFAKLSLKECMLVVVVVISLLLSLLLGSLSDRVVVAFRPGGGRFSTGCGSILDPLDLSGRSILDPLLPRLWSLSDHYRSPLFTKRIVSLCVYAINFVNF